jgi:hypothetical protein
VPFKQSCASQKEWDIKSVVARIVVERRVEAHMENEKQKKAPTKELISSSFALSMVTFSTEK